MKPGVGRYQAAIRQLAGEGIEPRNNQRRGGRQFSFAGRLHDLYRYGEIQSAPPGSESVARYCMETPGTWENHVISNRSFQQAEEARRRYGDMVVGLTHSRGVIGVMPDEFNILGTLEGVSSNA